MKALKAKLKTKLCLIQEPMKGFKQGRDGWWVRGSG